MKIKLTGFNAVIVLVLLAGYYVMSTQELESQGVEAIKLWLVAEAMRSEVAKIEDSGGIGENQDQLQELFDRSNIEIDSVKRRGVGHRVIARVKIRYKGETPPGGRNVRYFRMDYSIATGWWVRSEAAKWSYYMTLW